MDYLILEKDDLATDALAAEGLVIFDDGIVVKAQEGCKLFGLDCLAECFLETHRLIQWAGGRVPSVFDPNILFRQKQEKNKGGHFWPPVAHAIFCLVGCVLWHFPFSISADRFPDSLRKGLLCSLLADHLRAGFCPCSRFHQEFQKPLKRLRQRPTLP